MSNASFGRRFGQVWDLGLVFDIGEPDGAIGGPDGGWEIVLGACAGQADGGLLPFDRRLIVEEQLSIPGPAQIRRFERERPRARSDGDSGGLGSLENDINHGRNNGGGGLLRLGGFLSQSSLFLQSSLLLLRGLRLGRDLERAPFGRGVRGSLDDVETEHSPFRHGDLAVPGGSFFVRSGRV